MMEKATLSKSVEPKTKERYDQPVLIRHGSLRDVTGTSKLYEKITIEMTD
jgi:hypothetical protein